MKNIALIILLALMAISAKNTIYEPTNSTAEVEIVEGIYIFYMSKPVKEYTYLGTHKISISWTGQPDELFNTLIRKSKKKYPDLQAIIISDDMDKCDAIKFK